MYCRTHIIHVLDSTIKSVKAKFADNVEDISRGNQTSEGYLKSGMITYCLFLILPGGISSGFKVTQRAGC